MPEPDDELYLRHDLGFRGHSITHDQQDNYHDIHDLSVYEPNKAEPYVFLVVSYGKTGIHSQNILLSPSDAESLAIKLLKSIGKEVRHG